MGSLELFGLGHCCWYFLEARSLKNPNLTQWIDFGSPASPTQPISGLLESLQFHGQSDQ